MKKLIFITLLLFITMPAFAVELEFRNYRLGMPIEDLISQMKQEGVWSEKKCSIGHTFCHLDTMIKDVMVKITFMIKDNSVTDIMMIFDPNSYDVLKNAMLEKYGKGSAGSGLMQNGFGATIKNETTTWMLPEGIIQISKYSNKITEGSIFMARQKDIDAVINKRAKSPGF